MSNHVVEQSESGVLDRFTIPPLAILLSYLPVSMRIFVTPRLANWLSISRIVPAAMMLRVGALLPSNNHSRVTEAIWLTVASVIWFAFSDVFDGAAARYAGTSSGIGGKLDPGFDFLVIIAFHVAWVWSTFKYNAHLGSYLLALIIIRAVFQLGIGAAGTKDEIDNHEPVKAGMAGKIKTTIDCVVIIPFAIISTGHYGTALGTWTGQVAVVLTVATLILGIFAIRFHLLNASRGRGWKQQRRLAAA